MHVFQPIPIDTMEFNPFESFGKDWALVSAGSRQKANTMTVSWGGVGVLWGKNVAFIFVRDSRYTKELIDAGSSVLLCHKLSATKLTADSFLSPEIAKWYADGDLHTMYVGEILELMAK